MNEKIAYINCNLLEIVNQHAPYTKKPAPWRTDNVCFMMKLQYKALVKFRKTRLPQHCKYCKFVRNLVNLAIIK